MDLWQGFKDSSNWIKADVVIVNLATLIVSIKVFGPLVRWCRMTIGRLAKWTWQTLIWIRNRPSIRLLDDPSHVNVLISKDSQMWSTQFRIKLRNRDNDYPVHFSFEDMKFSLVQGRLRSKSTDLDINFAEVPMFVDLQPQHEWESPIIRVQRNLTNTQVPWAVNLNKPYKWNISGISALVYPEIRRSLRRFRGVNHGNKKLGNI